MDFRVNCLLKGDLQQDQIISQFFDSALAQLAWFKDDIKSPELALEEVYQGIDYRMDELRYGKATATVEVREDGILFSFGIRNLRPDFSEKNENGYRPWLRGHLDDAFFHYARLGMREQKHDSELPAEKRAHISRLLKAVDVALNSASRTYWIEGE